MTHELHNGVLQNATSATWNVAISCNGSPTGDARASGEAVITGELTEANTSNRLPDKIAGTVTNFWSRMPELMIVQTLVGEVPQTVTAKVMTSSMLPC